LRLSRIKRGILKTSWLIPFPAEFASVYKAATADKKLESATDDDDDCSIPFYDLAASPSKNGTRVQWWLLHNLAPLLTSDFYGLADVLLKSGLEEMERTKFDEGEMKSRDIIRQI
jgi:hypothetical protein